jgi:hypothetical protein
MVDGNPVEVAGDAAKFAESAGSALYTMQLYRDAVWLSSEFSVHFPSIFRV